LELSVGKIVGKLQIPARFTYLTYDVHWIMEQPGVERATWSDALNTTPSSHRLFLLISKL